LYSYEVMVSRDKFVRAGLRASYVSRGLDVSSLVFGDELATGSGGSTSDLINQKVRYLDLAAGVLYYSKKYWVGGAIDHINRPNHSLIPNTETRLPAKYSLHGGYVIPAKKSVKGIPQATVTLAANYKAQQKWDQVDIGAYYTQEPLFFGLWYRGIPLLKAYQPGYSNNDAVAFLVGYKTRDFRVGYSYDFTISRLSTNTGGAHEIAIVWEYATEQKRKKKKKQKFLVPCAKF
jgi:type IX secretion system PorP/SprF family membrane protein